MFKCFKNSAKFLLGLGNHARAFNSRSFLITSKAHFGKKSPVIENQSEEDNSEIEDNLYSNILNKENIRDMTKTFNKVAENLNCMGCGSILQVENESSIGYIPLEKLQQYIDHKQVDLQQKEQVEPPKELDLIHDRQTIKKLVNLENKKKVIICQRCYKLKHYMNFSDLNKKENQKNFNEKMENYTNLIKKINPNILKHQIVTRISQKSHVFYICVTFY